MWCPVNRDLGCIEISPIEVVSLLEAQFKNWSATPVVVATSVVDLVVTRSIRGNGSWTGKDGNLVSGCYNCSLRPS